MTSQCILCVPREGEEGHAPEPGWRTCWRGRDRMAAALRDIPLLVDELAGLGYVERDVRPKLDHEGRTAVVVGDRGRVVELRADPVAYAFAAGPTNGARTGPRVMSSGERSLPIRVDPTDLLLPARPASLAVAVTGGYPDDQIGHLAVATELEFWARDWADLLGHHIPLPTVRALAPWLLDRLDWACAAHPALDEFAGKLWSLRSTLTAATGRSPVRPETLSAPCPECGMLTLYRDPDLLDRVVCGSGCAWMATEDEYARYVLGSIRPEDPSMKKIPTLFLRDPDDMKRVTEEVHPDCRWVLDGEGTPTRKYDGTCMLFDGAWWARREVKPGKTPPPLFDAVSTDENTGKTMGWEPVAQSAFAKYHAEALAGPYGLLDFYPVREPVPGATYELCGPKVNGNPEKLDRHVLVRHGYRAAVDDDELRGLKLDHDSLRDWLLAHPAWEGIVWHHPDGRMAKLKRRDFPEVTS